MLSLRMIENANWLLQILVSIFLAILFLQSGIDKVADRRGNLEFLRGHFAKSPLAGMVPFLVTIVSILEIVAGGLSAIGCMLIILNRNPTLAFPQSQSPRFSSVSEWPKITPGRQSWFHISCSPSSPFICSPVDGLGQSCLRTFQATSFVNC